MPAEKSRSPAPTPQPPGISTDQAARPRTVLVVDDDADIRLSLADLLEENGYRVFLARNGQEALDYCRSASLPDCIILDLWMPVMDGWRLARALTERKFPPIPIVVVTAAESLWKYPETATHVMRKPIRPDPLLALVADAIERNPA